MSNIMLCNMVKYAEYETQPCDHVKGTVLWHWVHSHGCVPVLHSSTKLPCVPKLDTEAGFELWSYWLLTVRTG